VAEPIAAEARRAARVWRLLLWFGLGLAAVLAFGPPSGEPMIEGQDKLQHVAAFAALTLAACLAYPWPARSGLPRDAVLAAALMAYGVAIEVIQLFIPGRNGSLADVLADALGVALGLLLARLWRRRRGRR